MKELRVAVWGLGHHALHNILPALDACPGVALYGVCSRNTQVVARTTAATGCVGWNDPQDMLDDSRVDVVYLSTPIGLHAEQGRTVLAADKHLWCEKPLSGNADDATALAKLSRARRLTLAEGFMYLYHPQFRYLQHVVKSGELGYIHSVSCRFGIPPLRRPSFRDSPELGGGAFLDVGCYPISAITSFFPDADPDVRFAEIGVARGSLVDTSGRAVLRFANDVCALLEWGIRCAYRNEIDFWGTNGSVFSERIFSKGADYVPRFRFLDQQGRERYEHGTADNHFVAMLRSFRNLIDDADGAEHERASIMRRALVSDQIREQSRQ